MGQYWIPVNLDKREYIDPHQLGSGLKLWEQLASDPGTGAALIVLLGAQRETRGGGDLDLKSHQAIARRTIGRWAGDRVAIVGDYAELGDLAEKDNADLICDLCGSPSDLAETISHLSKGEYARHKEKARRLKSQKPFTNITGDVCRVIEHELQGKFTGTGWKDFTRQAQA